MDRGKEIELTANAEVDGLNGLEGFDKTDMINMFGSGVTWADEHPKEIEGCKFCKQEEVITHKSKECDLSYDGETLCVDIDMPLTWGSATGYYGFDINYCPFCGKKLNRMPYYIKRTKAKKKDKPLPLFDKAGVTVKKKPDLKAKLDKEFSLFIRLRDCMPNGFFRCISCGQIKPFEQADNGHYFSRTHLATRFDEDNCHAECRHCNRFKADHLEGYRVNLIAKIGQQRFDLLKMKAAGTSKMTDFEYEQLIKYYKALNKKLRKEKGL